jgi:hypothetical protein
VHCAKPLKADGVIGINRLPCSAPTIAHNFAETGLRTLVMACSLEDAHQPEGIGDNLDRQSQQGWLMHQCAPGNLCIPGRVIESQRFINAPVKMDVCSACGKRQWSKVGANR